MEKVDSWNDRTPNSQTTVNDPNNPSSTREVMSDWPSRERTIDQQASKPEEQRTEGAAKDLDTEWFYDPDDHGFRRIIRHFTPSWYIIIMGTGILSILLHELPYNGNWLRIISTIFFVLNITLFTIFTIMSGLRYAMYPELWGVLIRDTKSMFFIGTVPTGFFTIINMIVLVCVPAWGNGMATLAWVLWWIDTVVAIGLFFHLTFTVINVHRTDLSAMTALWLLSIVPVLIASASGGLVATVLENPQHKLWTLIISYVLWGMSFPLAMIILVLYFHRLTVHEMLSKEAVVTVLLPVAPLGLGGYSLIVFGKLALTVFPKTQSLDLVRNGAEVLYVLGFVTALILWGFGIFWFFLAIAMVIQSGGFPFSMGWWSFTFPIGVFALSTIDIGNGLNSRFFKVLATVLTAILVILWIIVAIGTFKGAITGKMFYAPCLETDMKAQERKLKRMAAKMKDVKNT